MAEHASGVMSNSEFSARLRNLSLEELTELSRLIIRMTDMSRVNEG